MAKKGLFWVFVFVITMAYSNFCWSAEDYEAKLRDVRYKKAAAEMNYKKRLADGNQKGNADLEAIKADFHAKRNDRINKLKDEQQKLTDSYEAEIAPLVEEEQKLLQALAPSGSNFVKPKARDVK